MRGTKAKRLRREAAAKRALQPAAMAAFNPPAVASDSSAPPAFNEARLRAELESHTKHDLHLMAGQSWAMPKVWSYKKKADLVDAMVAFQKEKHAA